MRKSERTEKKQRRHTEHQDVKCDRASATQVSAPKALIRSKAKETNRIAQQITIR